MTTTQNLTEGATIVIAGRNFTVDTMYSHIVLLTSDRGTSFVVARNSGRPVRINSLGSTLRHGGSPVLVRTANDTIEQVA